MTPNRIRRASQILRLRCCTSSSEWQRASRRWVYSISGLANCSPIFQAAYAKGELGSFAFLFVGGGTPALPEVLFLRQRERYITAARRRAFAATTSDNHKLAAIHFIHRGCRVARRRQLSL